MSKMLGREMTILERSSLINMVLHPGYKVLREMMDQYCRLVTDEVIKCDPIKEGREYKDKLANLQMIARVSNDFCSSLVRSIEVHQSAEGLARGEQDAVDALRAQLDERKQPE